MNITLVHTSSVSIHRESVWFFPKDGTKDGVGVSRMAVNEVPFGMGFFKRDKTASSAQDRDPAVVDLSGVDVSSIVDSPEFDEWVANSFPEKHVTFRIVRFVEQYHPTKHIRGRFGTTHSAIVVKAKGKKEFEAFLTISDRKITKSFVDKFYG